MLKKLILENWKSFRYAELPLDPLTVLIGTNASGKSNVVEALEFLQRIARGEDVKTALAGDKMLPAIRGGVEWAAHKPENKFSLKASVQLKDSDIDYIYNIEVATQPLARILENSILTQEYKNNNQNYVDSYYLYKLTYGYSLSQNKTIPMKLEFLDEESGESDNNITQILEAIQNIFILNPIPSKMRDYSHLSETLESDSSNIAGVIAALTDEQKAQVESTLSEYIKYLPEGDIKKVWAEKVGRFRNDAMLYCQEEWKPGEITEIDARSMSDGTLRFLAILTALLTRPEGSQIVIEEIDNGLHPSRAALLVKILKEIGSKRNIDILLTTHNPALLDAFGSEIVPFVVVAHRDSETGESKLTLLEDIENLPLLLASGTLGRLATKGAIEKSLSNQK
ncbi:AAA family ATPase [Anabaena lutea]|uniref:AAA family ATPase n=1 Tax=Anabaena lutea FACHB-196 TaxID=2692881 RepID=A0ABR8FM19_9NOST|nr:ATP-binding protein [Anabaena lutea]MBD2569979.1 AAA family ATPase [Anabaena lutea FACHB-196]